MAGSYSSACATESRSPPRVWRIAVSSTSPSEASRRRSCLHDAHLVLTGQVHISPRVSMQERAFHVHHHEISVRSFPPSAARCNAIISEVRKGVPANNSSSRSPESTLRATIDIGSLNLSCILCSRTLASPSRTITRHPSLPLACSRTNMSIPASSGTWASIPSLQRPPTMRPRVPNCGRQCTVICLATYLISTTCSTSYLI